MGQALPTTDTTASVVEKTVDGIFTNAIPIVEAGIITAQPLLGIPVVKQLWEALFSYIVGQFSGVLSQYSGHIVMDLQEYSALKSASQALLALQTAQKSGDQVALTKANSDMDQAAANLLHYHGDAHP